MTLRVENNSVIVEFSDQSTSSETWEMGNFKFKFVYLPSNHELTITSGDYVKVIDGHLTNPERVPIIQPFEKSLTTINQEIIKASQNTYLLIVTNKNHENLINSPQDVLISGPFNNLLVWNRVDSLPWGVAFQGIEFYNLRGWDLRNLENHHIAYIQVWLAGSGVNCGNHNHSEMGPNTFREIHLCLSNGSGSGGMVWLKDGEEKYLPLLSGEEHGPFYHWDTEQNKIVYPYHRWEAGISQTNSFDFWFAIELPPSQY